MTAALGRGRGPTVTGFLVADARRWSLGLDRAGRDLRTFSDEAAQVGLGISAGIGAGLVASTAAAINWQSAFTGVRKTVEGTPEELNQLAGELRDLAIELGLFPEQVAAIAEAAGQLGVSTQGIDEFTEVIGQLSQTTVLQAEEAAVSLARFAEVTGLIEMEYDELGSTIVALGNNFATNEAEIVALSQRLSSYGEIIGLSEAQTLAFATAASSVDLEAEAAGTALGRTFITIREAVDEGGDSLDTFAQVAGVTAQEFATAFSTDPAFAIEQFITGLGRLESSGQSSTAALEELGLSDVRVTRTLLTLANAGDLLNETLVTAETAWAENTALVDEFNERAEDTAFKLRQLVGSLIELGIVFGEDLEPVVGGLAAGLAVVVGEFSDVPPLVRTSTVVIASFTAATLAAASAAQLLGGKLTNARQQWAAFQAARAGSLVGRLTRAAAIAGTLGISIGAAATAMELLGRASETTAENVERIGRSTDEELAGIVDVALELEGALGNVFRNEFSDILDELQLQGAGGIDTLERLAAALELREGERAEFQLAAVSEALDLARQRARDTGQAVDDTGDSFNDLSIEASTLAAEVNAAVSEFLDGADAAELLRMELDGLIGTVDEAAGIGQDFERTLGDLVEAADDAGTSLDSFTDAGQQNQDLLAEAASQAREYSQAILEQTGSVDLADAAFRGQIGTLIEVATQLGFTRGQVLDYLASLGLIPASVVTEMLGDPSSALAAADAVTSAIFGVPTGVNIAFGADTRNLESALRVINAALGVFGGPQLSVEDFGDFLVRPSVRAGNIIGGTRSGGGGGGGGGGGADGPTELEIELERLAELYEFDRITRQEYIDALEALLGDYEDLSDEWVEIARQRNRELDEIAREEEEAAEEQERLLEKQTKALEDAIDDINKVLQRRIDDIRDLSEEYVESIRDSINEAADVLGLFGGELTTPTQDEMIDRLEHRLEAAQRFADGIEALERQGTPAGLVDSLAAGGLGNLALIESLATGDQTGRILGLIAEVDSIGAGLAGGLLGQRAPGFIDQAIAANPLPSQQAQQIVNIETNVTVLPDAEVITDAGGIERLFEDAAANVVEQVSDAVLVATRGGL